MLQLLSNALIAGSLAALIAGGLAFVYGVQGIFNLALGQMVLVGGYSTWWFINKAGLPLIPGMLGGFLVGALLAAFTFAVVVRPFVRHHRFLPLVTTIAWSMVLDGLILFLFDAYPRNILPSGKHAVKILGVYASTEAIILIVATVLLLSLFAYVLHSTALGRRIRAVVSHDPAAESLGIRASLLHLSIFIASGVLAAAAGIFIGIDQNLTPTLAFPLTIKAYAAVIAGGKGHLWGAILCAYLIAVLEQFAVGIRWFGLFTISAGFQSSIALAFIIGFLLIRPHGIFGSSSRTA